MLGLGDWASTRTLLWDRMPDGPFRELIERAYSKRGGARVGRAADFGGRTVLFSRLVFHLESPAGIVFPKVAGPEGIMRCRESTLWRAYAGHVLDAFGLRDVPPPPVPSITLSVRRRSASKNVGRVFADEAALARVLDEANAVESRVVDLGTLSFGEQLKLLRSTNVLVGAHGAALMHVIFLADEAVLLEIHPSYRLDRHFRLAARMAGRLYLPLRTTQPVACSGSSDAIPVDAGEFRAALDGAVRLARSFDDGVSECGLRCDARVLALDKGNDGHYKPGDRKAQPLSTVFPCH